MNGSRGRRHECPHRQGRRERPIQRYGDGDLTRNRSRRTSGRPLANYLVLETLNWIHTRQRHEKAVEFHRRLKASAGFELVHCARKDFTRAVELFESYETLAFGDATVVAYMEREGIESLYSFDDDFDAVDGITRLDTADDPFA